MALRELFLGLFRKKGEVKCPCCRQRLVPLPLYDGDTVEGKVVRLDREFLHFSCWCGYVFSRQRYAEFCNRSDLGWKPALNYPCKDMQGALLTTFNYD